MAPDRAVLMAQNDDRSSAWTQTADAARRNLWLLLLASAAAASLSGVVKGDGEQGGSDPRKIVGAQTSDSPARGSITSRASQPGGKSEREEIVVTASRKNLIGTAQTASQGSVTQEELELRPVYRVGQLLESVPGLVVTVHSGEAKAYQYLLRGVNLDHGIDFANFVDDMPVNRPSNAHGQGYSDLNFAIPQIFAGVDYTKGPYFAELGDFGSVGSEHMRILDDLPDQISVSAGTLGDDELFAGGTLHFDDGGKLLGAADVSRVDGPYIHPDNFRKVALVARYGEGTDADGYSLTAMYYKGQGRFSTDQPLRAIQSGLIGFYGTLDPTDGARSSRWSLSGHYGVTGDDWKLAANAYAIHSTQVLWNNFTYFLFDPVNGDQEQQDETRDTFGGGIAYTKSLTFGDIESGTTFGVQNAMTPSMSIAATHARESFWTTATMATAITRSAITPAPPIW